MTYYLKSGSIWTPTHEANVDIHKELPVGTYSVGASMQGLFLQTIDDFVVQEKIYGEARPRAQRIITSFMDRKQSTGVLLEGEKGSGKTFLARCLSTKLREMGMSTIIVNAAFCGESFNTFLSQIDAPTLIFFDEFEKIYDNKEQQQLLTLFDGTHPNKKMFVLALNDTYKVSDYFKNRPGRFYYRFTYKGLDEEFIREYCVDNLRDQKEIDKLCLFAETFYAFSFDMLKSLVEEMNRYDEGIFEVAKFINAQPGGAQFKFLVENYEGTITKYDEKKGKHVRLKATKWDKEVSDGQHLDPMKDSLYVGAYLADEGADVEDGDYEAHRSVSFSPRDIISIHGSTVVYQNVANGKLVMKREIANSRGESISYLDAVFGTEPVEDKQSITQLIRGVKY